MAVLDHTEYDRLSDLLTKELNDIYGTQPGCDETMQLTMICEGGISRTVANVRWEISRRTNIGHEIIEEYQTTLNRRYELSRNF